MRERGQSRARSTYAVRVKGLEQALRRKERMLSEQSVLLSIARHRCPRAVGGRGRFHGREVRERLLTLVREAEAAGARLAATCQLLGISLRTVQRWRQQPTLEDQRALRCGPPANRLTEKERQRVLKLIGAQVQAGFTPRHLVAKLADQGTYVASESTMYRLLRGLRQAAPRACPQALPEAPRQYHAANKPNHIWSWDISRLKTPVRGSSLYLYLVMDVFSRRIMGWHVDDRESGHTASRFIRRACEVNGLRQRGLLLHSDNGGPMRGGVMRATLRQMGICPSFSRPRMSSDNPFSEALFRTLKTRPAYPRVFSSLEQARAWMGRFVHWYNSEHLHSGISFVTPDARHFGRERDLLARRSRLYALAHSRKPGRWSGAPRVWSSAGPSLIPAWLPPGQGSASREAPAGDNPLDTQPPPPLPPNGSLVVT